MVRPFSETEGTPVPEIDDYLDQIIINRSLGGDEDLAALLQVNEHKIPAWRNRIYWPTEEEMLKLSHYTGIPESIILQIWSFWKEPEKYRAKGINVPSFAEIIDRAKSLTGIKSDRQLARKIGVQPSNIVNWKRGRNLPGDETMKAIASLADIEPRLALAYLDYWRAPRSTRFARYEIIEALRASAIAVFIALALSSPSETKAEQTTIEGRDGLYIMGNYLSRLLARIARFTKGLEAIPQAA